LFREYVRRGHTIMMSTHTLEVAETLCDRIAIIQHGKIRAVGSIQELRTQATGGGGLEEIFLKLTGEPAARVAKDVFDALRASFWQRIWISSSLHRLTGCDCTARSCSKRRRTPAGWWYSSRHRCSPRTESVIKAVSFIRSLQSQPSLLS